MRGELLDGIRDLIYYASCEKERFTEWCASSMTRGDSNAATVNMG